MLRIIGAVLDLKISLANLADLFSRGRHQTAEGIKPGPTQDPSLFLLFISFLRLGVTSFGGPAMIAYIRGMSVEEKSWLEEDTFRNGVALCQFIPGASAMQMAAYVGLRARGVTGAAISYIAFGLPAFLLITALSALYEETRMLPVTASLFSGLQAIIIAIVAYAAFTFARSYLDRGRDYAVAAVAAAIFIAGVSPFLVILLAALAGLLIYRGLPSIEDKPVVIGRQETIVPLILIFCAAGLGFVLLYLFRRDLFQLAASMFWVDLFAFGGGFASLPLMLNEVVAVRSWMDYQTFMSGIALGQITPGPIVITAAFVGYMVGGLEGSIVATLGMFLPSFLILIGTVPYYDQLKTSGRFSRAIRGILCSFVGLLASVAFSFASNMTPDLAHVFMAAAAFILLFKADLFWVILAGAVISVIFL